MSHRFCVLVVDDDPDTVETAAEVLSIHGFRVLTADCGAEALRVAAAESPDIVFSDLAMPRVNGYELAWRLRAGGKPPVLVAVTGYATERDRAKAAEAGFDLHLAKPVDPAVLVGLVKRIRDSIAEPGLSHEHEAGEAHA
jgi:CheY-like chemotaxis protein